MNLDALISMRPKSESNTLTDSTISFFFASMFLVLLVTNAEITRLLEPETISVFGSPPAFHAACRPSAIREAVITRAVALVRTLVVMQPGIPAMVLATFVEPAASVALSVRAYSKSRAHCFVALNLAYLY